MILFIHVPVTEQTHIRLFANIKLNNTPQLLLHCIKELLIIQHFNLKVVEHRRHYYEELHRKLVVAY